jgi:diaminopimelate epimerase
MFNPDGSEFERSGNGLRVLASHLARAGEVSPYRIEIGGDRVSLIVHSSSGATHDVSVEMGRARLGPEAVGLDPEALDPSGRLRGPQGEHVHVVPVSVGNPHMVAIVDEVDEERLHELGPFLVGHPALAHGANVQLARVTAQGVCEALIWERGVGPTSASGTSACAVAVALVSQRRLAPGTVSVRMPGGSMTVEVSDDLDVVLRGPVEEVCTGTLTDGFLCALEG